MSNEKSRRGHQLCCHVPYSKVPRSRKGSLIYGSANRRGTNSTWDSTDNVVLSVDSPTQESYFNFSKFIDYDMIEEKAFVICQKSFLLNNMYPDYWNTHLVGPAEAWREAVATESTFVPMPPEMSNKVSHSYY